MSADRLDIDDISMSHEEATETLRAIRSGRVDAVVVNRASGHGVVTFRDTDHAYRALVEAMGEGAALVTRDGLISYHNRRFAELTIGSKATSLRGRALRTLVASDAALSIDDLLERAQQVPARVEVTFGPEASGLTVQLTVSVASVDDEAMLCVIAIDLSEQRAQGELYRNALIGMEARDRLISIAGHELRTPMQIIVLELGVLLEQQRGLAATATIAQVEAIQRHALHLASLVGVLLDVRLIGSDQLELTTETVDLAELVVEIVKSSDDLAHSGSVVTIEASPIRGDWDRVRIEQVATNLISNAGKYGLGRPIHIVVKGGDGLARLVVEDHGIGVPRDALQRLFRPFERIGTVKTAKGLGLGLYITEQIVKAHGGVIRVESDPGAGSRFVVELPCDRPHAP
jgi:PAS domain S-box-containing protein